MLLSKNNRSFRPSLHRFDSSSHRASSEYKAEALRVPTGASSNAVLRTRVPRRVTDSAPGSSQPRRLVADAAAVGRLAAAGPVPRRLALLVTRPPARSSSYALVGAGTAAAAAAAAWSLLGDRAWGLVLPTHFAAAGGARSSFAPSVPSHWHRGQPVPNLRLARSQEGALAVKMPY